MHQAMLSFVLDAMAEVLPDGMVARRNGEAIDIGIDGEGVIETIGFVSSFYEPTIDALYFET